MFHTARLLDSYRDASEDRAEFLLVSDERLVLAVADGVGGRENGGNAATCAVEWAREATESASPSDLASSNYWGWTLHAIHRSLSADESCGETTLIILSMDRDRIVGAGVGDSEAWWIDPPGTARIISVDTRKPYLGSDTGVYPRQYSVAMAQTGTLLVATDGLFKYADANRIGRTIAANAANLPATAHALRDLAHGSSGTLYDDFAAVLVARD